MPDQDSRSLTNMRQYTLWGALMRPKIGTEQNHGVITLASTEIHVTIFIHD